MVETKKYRMKKIGTRFIDYNQFYHPEYKYEYLEIIRKQKSESTFLTYYSLMQKISEYEKKVDRDIFNFGISDVETMYLNLRLGASRTSDVIKTICIDYVYFCINKGWTKGNINHFDNMKTEVVKDTIVKPLQKYKYLTETEYKRLLKLIVNPMDRVSFVLVWEQCMVKGVDDIIHLKKQDIDFENRIVKTPSGNLVKISEFAINSIKEAIESEIYFSNNGEVTKRVKSGRKRRGGSANELETSDYIIRKVSTRAFDYKEGKPMAKSTFNSKTNALLRRLEIKGVTLKTLYHSSIAKTMIDIEKDLGRELSKKEIKDILNKQYDLIQGYFFFNEVLPIMREKYREEENIIDNKINDYIFHEN